MPLLAILQQTLYVPPPQQLFATIFDQPEQLTRTALSCPLFFDMMEDIPTTDIIAKQMDMNKEPSYANRIVEAGGDHPPSMDSEECTLEVNIVSFFRIERK
jgi:hypothetical protein